MMKLTYIGSLWSLHGLLVVVGLLLGGLVDQRGWSYGNALARGLEAVLIGTIFHDAHLAVGINVAVLALHLACGQFRFDLKGTIGTLIAVRIRAVLIVPDNLR